MDRTEIVALIQRSLGIRHKLKVHESLDAPETHEDFAIMLMTKWDLEDELRAIEKILDEVRDDRVSEQKTVIERDILKLVKKQNAKNELNNRKGTRK